MLLSHELPLNVTQLSHVVNDYDYALVHLMDMYPGYFNYMKFCVSEGRTVYLDNSLYELKETYDPELFARWTAKLDPTYYIVPDDYDYSKNIQLFEDFQKLSRKYRLRANRIAVVHGSTSGEFIDCYRYLDTRLGKNEIIAFSGGDVGIGDSRPDNIRKLYNNGMINTNRKHHILGCIHPTEYLAYVDLPFIYSGDTSLPVIASYLKQKLSTLTEKPEPTINRIFEEPIQWDRPLLRDNINYFRNMLGLPNFVSSDIF